MARVNFVTVKNVLTEEAYLIGLVLSGASGAAYYPAAESCMWAQEAKARVLEVLGEVDETLLWMGMELPLSSGVSVSIGKQKSLHEGIHDAAVVERTLKQSLLGNPESLAVKARFALQRAGENSLAERVSALRVVGGSPEILSPARASAGRVVTC